jgi:predicted Zn-dependent peptidase
LYRISKVQNGLRLATAEMPQMKGVSVGIWIGVGSRYEPAALNGVCHFIEHLLFKGTAKRSAREISQAVEGVGGYLNAFTSEEATCFHARASHDRFELLVDVLLDMLLHSRFAPADIAKERDVIKEELAMYMDEPQHQVQELLNATLWPDQPLGRPITGTASTLDRIRRTDLTQYLGRHYVPSATVIVAAGKVRHSDLVRAARSFANGFAVGARPGCAPAQAPPQSGPRVALFTKKTEQTQLALGIRTCSRHDERRYALRVLNAILGENMSSRLFQVVREDRGLAYSIYSTPSFFEDTGDLVISAGCDTGKLPEALRLICRELRRLTREAPGRSELQRARDYVLGQIVLGQESTEAQMNWVGEQLLGYGKIIPPRELERRLMRVTGREIRQAAADFFRPDHISLAVVSPLKRREAVERGLSGTFLR